MNKPIRCNVVEKGQHMFSKDTCRFLIRQKTGKRQGHPMAHSRGYLFGATLTPFSFEENVNFSSAKFQIKIIFVTQILVS